MCESTSRKGLEPFPGRTTTVMARRSRCYPRLFMSDLPFREDKTNKDWENPVEGRQLSAGGVKATMPPYSEPTTRNFLL